MYSETYYGQDVSGFTAIGTEEFQLPITEGIDIKATIEELERCCGRMATFFLFRPEDA